MTALEWDRIGERFFETGIDRGVLYTTDGGVVPWNGLTQISETSSISSKAFYMDGVKYLEHHTPDTYSAKLEAFTYPDVLDELTGSARYAPGVFLHDQRPRAFHISYRTGVGNDVDPSLGYKLHIVYNVIAVPADLSLGTIADTVEATKLSWNLSSIPQASSGPRPTSHISIHSRLIAPSMLASIETFLYGNDSSNPSLPSMGDLLTWIGNG